MARMNIRLAAARKRTKTPAPETTVVERSSKSRIKRVRVQKETPKAKKISVIDQEELHKYLKSISRAEIEMGRVANQRSIEVDELFKLLKIHGLTKWANKHGNAEITRTKGRDSNTIDVHAYRKLVTDEDFMDSIKVSSTEAKKVLPEKQLKEITDTVTGVMGSEFLVCKLPTIKKP